MFNDRTIAVDAGRFDAVAHAAADERADFLRRTYVHLAGAIAAFVGVEAFLLSTPYAETIARTLTGGWQWLLVLGAFMLVSHVAERWAHSADSLGKQYLGLGVFIVAEAIVFAPLLWVATTFFPPEDHLLRNAASLTLAAFTVITAIVFFTGKDFSFLRSALMLGGFAALGLIACSMIFGFTLGLGFSIVMAVFAAGSCLYTTGQVMHHYRSTQHVAAALSLFAAIALMFWYILRILMSLTSRD